MKNVLWTVLILLCGLCNAEAKVVDRIYAQVNEDIITLSDINRKMDEIRREYATKYTGAQLEEAVKAAQAAVLDMLIQEKLLVQKAIELGVDADVDPKVSSEIQEIMKNNNIETMDAFEEALEQQGSNLRDFRDLIKNKIMADEIIRMFVSARITLMKNEVEKFYKDHADEYATPEEISLSEITVTVAAEGSRENAEKRTRDLYNRLQKGESFASLAGQYSRGATANKGGGIGSNLIEKWHPDIVKAIAGLEAGDISEPQNMKDGYVIYRVDSRKHSTLPPLKDIESQIKNRLFMNKFNPELDRYITRLKEEAYIQLYPETE